jgi:hypothetical protein
MVKTFVSVVLLLFFYGGCFAQTKDSLFINSTVLYEKTHASNLEIDTIIRMLRGGWMSLPKNERLSEIEAEDSTWVLTIDNEKIKYLPRIYNSKSSLDYTDQVVITLFKNGIMKQGEAKNDEIYLFFLLHLSDKTLVVRMYSDEYYHFTKRDL